MKQLSFFTFLLFVCQCTIAQVPSLLLLQADSVPEDRLLMTMGARLEFGSTVFDNAFLGKFVLGGNISDQSIDNISSRLSDVNHAGFNALAGLAVYSFEDSVFGVSNLGLSAGFSTMYDGQLSISRDAFDLIFKGNEMFRGGEAELSPTYFQNLAFQKFGLGVFDKNDYSGIMISLVNGQQLQRFELDESRLFTSAMGDSLHLSYTGEFAGSDTSRTGFGVLTGVGVALDANINLPMPDNRGFISLSFENMGFISWLNGFETYRFDSSATWTGINANGIFDFNTDTLGFDQLRDTIHTVRTVESRTTGLPSRVKLNFLRRTGERDYYEAGVILQPNRSSIPLLHAGYTAGLGKSHFITLRALFGGYQYFRMGWQYQALVRNSWYVSVGMDNWPGVFSGHAQGMSGSFSVAKYFGKSRVDHRDAMETMN